MPGVTFWSDKCQEDKFLEAIFYRTNARRTNAWTHFFGRTNARSHFLVGQMPGGQVPGRIFWSDECREDKCLEAIFYRTNARRTDAWTHFFGRTNAWKHFLVGQMPGVQMPGGNFLSDKCQE